MLLMVASPYEGGLVKWGWDRMGTEPWSVETWRALCMGLCAFVLVREGVFYVWYALIEFVFWIALSKQEEAFVMPPLVLREVDAKDVDAHLVCPVSMELMRDPVVARDGCTYERSVIQTWFAKQVGTPPSPVTGKPLADCSLVPNMALRHIIADKYEGGNETR